MPACRFCKNSGWEVWNEDYRDPGAHVTYPCRCKYGKRVAAQEKAREVGAADHCICTQLTALEPVVNPDCPVHGPLRR